MEAVVGYHLPVATYPLEGALGSCQSDEGETWVIKGYVYKYGTIMCQLLCAICEVLTILNSFHFCCSL